MKSYKHLEKLRRDQDVNSAAKATGYFDFKYKVKPPKTAAQLESLIEEIVNRSGGKVSIITTAGRKLVDKKEVSNVLGHRQSITNVKYIPSTTKRGTPDILGALPDGTALAIEVKFSKSDRMSKEQLTYQQSWPGVFVIARTLDDVMEVL